VRVARLAERRVLEIISEYESQALPDQSVVVGE
jgi:hypothetical protein